MSEKIIILKKMLCPNYMQVRTIWRSTVSTRAKFYWKHPNCCCCRFNFIWN